MLPVGSRILRTGARLARPTQQTRSIQNHTKDLIRFSTDLTYDALPAPVVSRTKEWGRRLPGLDSQLTKIHDRLFVDFFCCALGGRGYPSLVALEKFAQVMGPQGGACELIAPGKGAPASTSPYFAAMVNAAAGHIVEQDDLHNASVVHPATVVFPAALAAAQDLGSSGKDFILASVVGYEVACRVGEMLGTEHYRVFHTTGTAGTVGAAAAVAKLLNLSPAKTTSAIGTAGTQAAGLWQFASDAAMSKQVHTAHAASTGLMSAYTARDGLVGAKDILLGKRGMAKGLAFGQEWPGKLVQGLGHEWKMTETSFKYWASCRHTHPSADALLALLTRHRIATAQIKSITAHVYQAALDVLSPAEAARTVHECKFSMGFVLAVMAKKRSALLNDFDDAALLDPQIRALQSRVTMVHDEDIQAEYPQRWVGHVFVETVDGKKFDERVVAVKGDPDNTLSREEIMIKGRSLAAFGGSSFVGDRLEKLFENAWRMEELKGMRLMD